MSGADIRKDGTTAESWDWKMANPRIDEPYKEQYRKQSGVEGPMEGRPARKPPKPMEPDKPLEENPNYQTELKKEDQRNRKTKKAAKKGRGVKKPTSEFLEKYYGKDWA